MSAKEFYWNLILQEQGESCFENTFIVDVDRGDPPESSGYGAVVVQYDPLEDEVTLSFYKTHTEAAHAVDCTRVQRTLH